MAISRTSRLFTPSMAISSSSSGWRLIFEAKTAVQKRRLPRRETPRRSGVTADAALKADQARFTASSAPGSQATRSSVCWRRMLPARLFDEAHRVAHQELHEEHGREDAGAGDVLAEADGQRHRGIGPQRGGGGHSLHAHAA